MYIVRVSLHLIPIYFSNVLQYYRFSRQELEGVEYLILGMHCSSWECSQKSVNSNLHVHEPTCTCTYTVHQFIAIVAYTLPKMIL